MISAYFNPLEFDVEIEKVGMIGGVIAFGFLGLFLGLTLLATKLRADPGAERRSARRAERS
jgi:hypothetical protein